MMIFDLLTRNTEIDQIGMTPQGGGRSKISRHSCLEGWTTKVPRKTNKISERQTLEIIIKRALGRTQAEIAKDYDVSEQTIQYYESKEETQELKSKVLEHAAEVAGKALGELAVAKALAKSAGVDNSDAA